MHVSHHLGAIRQSRASLIEPQEVYNNEALQEQKVNASPHKAVSFVVQESTPVPSQARHKVYPTSVHPTKAFFASCIPRILSLKNSWSRNP